MKDILEAFASRIRSPVWGYFCLSWFAINWKSICYLFMSSTPVEERFNRIDTYTSWMTLFLFPSLIAMFMTVFLPWINLFFLKINLFPTVLRNNIQVDIESRRLLRQAQLENNRREFLSIKEQSIIEQAKRDEEIDSIEDEDIKRAVHKDISQLRKEILKVNGYPQSTDMEITLIDKGASQYFLNVKNIGKATAKNIDIKFLDKQHPAIENEIKDRFPIEYLFPGKSVPLTLIRSLSSPSSFTVTISWEEGQNNTPNEITETFYWDSATSSSLN